MRKRYTIKLNDREIQLGQRTIIMGILNVTPDSFSDGGKFSDKDKAAEHALKMVDDGADIIDIGGESTRPGSEAVTALEEIKRTIPAIEAIRKKSDIPISIDTYKAEVVRKALEAGANIINDISACNFDPGMKSVAANAGCPVIIMHIKGTPRDMQKDPTYNDVIKEISDYLEVSIRQLTDAGVKREQIIIDPGIGFGKTTEHNLTIMNRLEEFQRLDRPILMGVSRKSVIGNVLDLPTDQRIFGTAAAVTANIMKGAHIVRVHDVAEMKQVAQMTDTIGKIS